MANEQATPARRQADDLRERQGAGWEESAAVLAEFSYEELVGRMAQGASRDVPIPTEMSRRVIVSNGELRQAIDRFRDSAEKSSKRLEVVTWVLVVLTVVLVVLTILTVVLIVVGGE